MKLQKAIALFLQEHKPSTRQAYAQCLSMMAAWVGPNRDLRAVRPDLLVEYAQVVIRGRGYALATQQKHIKAIKTFFNWCVRLGLVNKSPAAAVRGSRLPLKIDRSKAMSDDELRRLLDYLRYKPRDYALIMFLADTGCRRGGAAGLKLGDIDWSSMVAIVTEKGGKTRKVAFGRGCAEAIQRWLAYRSSRYRIRDVYVFTRDGSPMQAENVSLIIRRACRAAGVRVLSSHSLRHRKGHQLADARVAPSIAAAALGHSDPVITLTYYYPHDWESAERALRELTLDAQAPPSKITLL